MNIEDRLAKLERENRTWRLAAISLAGILGLSIACSGPWNEPAPGLQNQATAQATDAIHEGIRVRHLEIVGDNGHTFGSWRHTGGGSVLELSDGESGISLSAGKGVAMVALSRGDWDTFIFPGHLDMGRVRPEQRDDEFDLDETRLVKLSARGQAGGGSLTIYNTFGERVATLQSDKTNHGILVLGDVSGKPVRFLSGGR